MSRTAARFSLSLLFLSLAACDKVALVAPTDSTVNLTVSQTTLPINGSAEVVATVIESAGTAVHNGTTVTFTSSFGVVEPREARTEGGVARATFRAGTQSGVARIGAFSGASRATEVEVRVGGAAAESVRVRAVPSTVPSSGGHVQLFALVLDGSGNALPGVPVAFTADNGTLDFNSAVSDENGEARNRLFTNRQSMVRAAVAAREGTVTINVVNLPTATISLTPTNPIVDLPVTFSVTPGNVTNGNPIQNVMLDFGDGTAPHNFGAITGATPVQHTYRRADTYTATLTVTDTGGQRTTSSIQVVVQRAVVSASFTAAPSTGQIGTAVTFTVAVANPSNIPLQGVSVNFGDGLAPVTLGPTGGSAQKTYTIARTYTVTATPFDINGTQYPGAQTQIIIAPAAAFNVTLDGATGDAAAPVSCTPAGAVYPKTCVTNFIGIGTRVVFTAACSTGVGTAPCANAFSYVWRYGDGTTETTTSSGADHVFGRGTWEITVTVNTSTGGSSTQRLTLNVL